MNEFDILIADQAAKKMMGIAERLKFLETIGIALNNVDAVTDPTISDDTLKGYSRESFWQNTLTGDVFICSDPTEGASVWKKFSFNGDALDSATSDGDLNPEVLLKTDSSGDLRVSNISLGPDDGEDLDKSSLVQNGARSWGLHGSKLGSTAKTYTFTQGNYSVLVYKMFYIHSNGGDRAAYAEVMVNVNNNVTFLHTLQSVGLTGVMGGAGNVNFSSGTNGIVFSFDAGNISGGHIMFKISGMASFSSDGNPSLVIS